MSVREHLKLTGAGLWYAIVAVVVCFGIAVLVAATRPAFLGFERQQFKASFQYSEGQTDALLTLARQYDKLEVDIAKYKAIGTPAVALDGGVAVPATDTTVIVKGLEMQQQTIADSIRQKAKLLPPEAVPQEAQRFLAGGR